MTIATLLEHHCPRLRALLLLILVLVLGPLSAASLPAGFAETQIATGLDPTTMTFAPDGRLFLCEKPGRVRIIKDDALLATPFIDISAVVDNFNERGLMSVCFDPQFASNGWVYLYYTRKEGTRRFHRVGRYTANGDVVTGGETVIFDMTDQGSASNHNGGGMRFGADGKLYLSTGDNAVSANAQNTGNQLGKLLRINKDGSIPSDNPNYAAYSGNNRAIVALGLRNAFTLAIQPGTGLLYVNDVGTYHEEINRYDTGVAPVHRNFGWPIIDGPRVHQIPPDGYLDPVYAYNSGKAAICGGDFYNPANPGPDAFPTTYHGTFIFCDYAGWIKYIDPANPGTRLDFATGAARPIDVKIAPDGALWYIARAGQGGGSNGDNTSSNNGSLWRVRWTGGNQATRLAFLQQPSAIDAGAIITPAVRVAIQDADGNTVTASTASVSLSIGANPGGSTLSGTTTIAAVNGVATFSNLSLGAVGTGYTLTAASPGLTGATSSAFNVQARVTTPVITPNGGSYTGPAWVQITTTTSGATIRYTVDGSTPNATSAIYTAPFQRTGTTTVRAYATRSGFTDSAMATAVLTITGSTAYGLDYRPPVTGIAMPAAVTGSLPGTLSATGMFSTTSSLTPKPGVIPFDVINPLWSDHADKRRWVALPGSATIGFQATGEFSWPGGTVFAKHFDIATSSGGTRRLETRLLVLDASGTNGYGVTYRWRSDNSDADLVVAGGQDEVLGSVAGSPTWHYPSRNECLQCHTSTAGFVLGPKTRQLNRTYAYPGGRNDNQLRTWNYLQMFGSRIDEGAIPNLPRLVALGDTSASLVTRVRSYLDSNCAGCHRPGGTGAFFDTRFDTALDQQGIIDGGLRDTLGIPDARVVRPGDLAASILHLRMHSNDPTRRMPPLGRNVVDTAAVDVIAQWIGSMPNGTGLTGEYWTNQTRTFTGPATVTRLDAGVDFAWGTGSPATGVTADRFTARWTGQVEPAVSETYTFHALTDDGVRLWVNNQLIIDRWYDQSPTEGSGSITLMGGTRYDLRMEYFESTGGAQARLSWSSPSTPKAVIPAYRLFPAGTVAVGTGLTGHYWTNQLRTFTGSPTATRLDAMVDFAWASGSPAPGVSADLFTARWTGQVEAPTSETYTFFVFTDDGVRLWVDNQLIIDRWIDQSPTEASGSIALTAGTRYDIRMEYFENTGGAQARLSWSSPSVAKAVVPTSRLFPTSGEGPAFASLVVTPSSALVMQGGTVHFQGEARDAAGTPLAVQPSVTWSASGGGAIATDGTFTASTMGGPFLVTGTATVDGVTQTGSALVTVGFGARICFQPASAPVPQGWQVDAGLVYGVRGNGLTYGWNANVADTMRDRNLTSDQTRDTVVHLQKAPVTDAVWEIAVPNGTYQVIAVSGDPGYFDSVFRTTAEGQLIIDGTPTSANRFLETTAGGATVVVNDGRLTLRSGSGAQNNKLNLVEIVQVPIHVQ